MYILTPVYTLIHTLPYISPPPPPPSPPSSPIVSHQNLSQTHLPKHLHHRLHRRLVSYLEGGGVHQASEVDRGNSALEQLLVHSTGGVNEEDTRLSCGALLPGLDLVWGVEEREKERREEKREGGREGGREGNVYQHSPNPGIGPLKPYNFKGHLHRLNFQDLKTCSLHLTPVFFLINPYTNMCSP